MSAYLRKAVPVEIARGRRGSPATTPGKVRGARPAANDPVTRESGTAAVDPMLLVYRERVRTFELLAELLRRGIASLLGRA